MNLRSLLRRPVLTLAIHDREARWTLGRGGAITASGTAALPPRCLDDGRIADAPTVSYALRESAGFPGRGGPNVIVGVPAQRAIVRRLELPPLRGKQLDELIDREIRREMPMLGENTYLAWKRSETEPNRVTVSVVAVARDVLDSHVGVTRAIRLKPLAGDLRIIAAARAGGQTDCVIAHVEDAELEIGIFRDGIPSVVRFVHLSAADDLAWLDQIAEELNRTIKFYRDSHREDVAVNTLPISLVGGAALRAALDGRVAGACGRSVVIPRLVVPLRGQTEAARFAVNVGLALKKEAA